METIKDIVAELREFADADSQSIGRDVLRRRIQHFADRIEQSVTKCNQFKMREALERIIKQVYEVDECTNADVPYLRAFINHIQQTAILALSAPPRNNGE